MPDLTTRQILILDMFFITFIPTYKLRDMDAQDEI